jgi:alkanesulfonate monooxygenase SsuD/methylene tetrahydromethanopterin reductase-like flavin-dependent oxidoreductase (luciferase family)
VKVLLDQNLGHRLRKHLGRQNGYLLEAAEEGGFDVLVTADQTFSYEQT